MHCNRWRTGLVLAGLLVLAPPIARAGDGIEAAVAGEHRSAAHKARDRFRHPVETLRFFGLEPDMNVLEIWPGGAGWYTEILAPVLRQEGRLTVAIPGPGAYSHPVGPRLERGDAAFAEKIAGNPEIYDRVRIVQLWVPKELDLAPPASLDMVVTFRNLHNWLAWDQADEVLAAFHAALKPGGILGVTDHRADPAEPMDPKARSGYVDEAYAIRVIQAAGFRLVDHADINDNPADTKDHPRGVWTLPPTFALGDEDREKYAAIGESDRFTLKFIKPE